MTTNDDRSLQWLAGSLTWERTLATLRETAAGADAEAEPKTDIESGTETGTGLEVAEPEVVAPVLALAPEPVGAVHSLDHRRALRARRHLTAGTCPAVGDRDGRPGNVAADGGVSTSA